MPRALQSLIVRLRALLFSRAENETLDEELRYHLDQQVARHRSHGMSTGEARAAARRELGGVERLKDDMRDTRRVTWIENLLRDLRHAFRALRRSPGYTFTALLTLALGLGANAAIFTVVNSVLLRPLGYREPGRLAVIDGTVAPGTYLDWRAAMQSWQASAVAEWWSPTYSGGSAPEQITALRLSGGMLPMLGVAPLLGRLPSEEEAHGGRQYVVLLSYQSWQRRFNGDPGVLNRTITLDAQPYTIIGVMPPDFHFAPYWATHAEMWSLLELDSQAADRSHSSMRLFARLGPGVTLAAAQSELNGVSARLEREYPGTQGHPTLVSLDEMVVGDVRPALRILMGAVGLVLLIACANVAHLQLLRAAARAREGAVRVALGASRARLIQQSLVESTLLALGGAALGLLVAWGGIRLLVRLSPANLPRLADIRLDGTVYGFLVVAALLSSVLFGLAPALKASRLEIGDALKEGSRSTSDGPKSKRLRGLLVVSEFATALVLLVGASLLLRSFARLSAVDTGFGARNALTFAVSLRGTGHAEPAARDPFYRELLERLRALPGVEAAGAVNHLPIAGDNWRFSFVVEGRPVPPPDEAPRALFRVARPGYFAAMQIPMVRGRDVSAGDGHVVVVNQTMARRYWQDSDPIGQRISVDDPARRADWYTVIGVVHDVTQGRLKESAMEEMFFPALPYDAAATTGLRAALYPSEMMFVVRTSGEPAALSRPVQDLVRSMDAAAPVHHVATMRDVLGSQFVEPTFYLLLLGSFAGLAVVLAAVGVYGVLSYSARRRTHEMGVRLALGAGALEPFRLVAGEGLRLALVGGALGLVAALALTRQLRTLLFGVQPTDPLMFAAAALVLAAVALLALLASGPPSGLGGPDDGPASRIISSLAAAPAAGR